MHSCVTSKNVKWCHLIWPTLYSQLTSLSVGLLFCLSVRSFSSKRSLSGSACQNKLNTTFSYVDCLSRPRGQRSQTLWRQ